MATKDIISSQMVADDLLITIFSQRLVQFVGFGSQLIAEGLIPKNPKWPDRGIRASWSDEYFDYDVRRIKPYGVKLPKEEWLKLDYWRINRTPKHLISLQEITIREKEQEIEHIKFSNSPKGRAQYYKYCEARDDQSFQAFKDLITSPVKPKAATTDSSKQA